MGGEPTEIELKFEVEPEALARLKTDPRLAGELSAPRELLSTYFDTDERDLRKAGFTLRVRSEAGRRLQTVKSDLDGGLIHRGEWESEIQPDGEGFDLGVALDTPLRPLLGDGGLAHELKPLFATRVRRQIGRLAQDGSDIEVAFDEGEIEGDGRRSSLSELELELKQGAPASLFALAEELSTETPLKLSFVSKAARGYALVDGGVRACKIKPAPPLKAKTPAGQAFQAVARLCLMQFSANQRLVEGSRGPEAIHQMRVALRRMRSAIDTFAEVTADAERDAVMAELKWLAGELDEARDLSRYMTGLLVFLGLLGTFWGLIATVSSVGGVIGSLKVGGDAGSVFDALKEGLAAPLSGMGISFSSSLFGLAGSLVLGFLDLQSGQAQNRFYTDLEDWLSTTVRDMSADAEVAAAPGASTEIRAAIERLREAIGDAGSSKATTAAMANLAEAIQGLVHHMRTEQQMIRDWVDSQAEQHRDVRRLLEMMVRETVDK